MTQIHHLLAGGLICILLTAAHAVQPKDEEITRKIRQNIVQTKGVSVYAQNVQIETTHGRVVLKGPVKSESEKRMIEEAAAKVAGANNITSQIVIAK